MIKGREFVIINIPKEEEKIRNTLGALMKIPPICNYYKDWLADSFPKPWAHSEFTNPNYKHIVFYVMFNGEISWDFDYVMLDDEYWEEIMSGGAELIDWEVIVNENA